LLTETFVQLADSLIDEFDIIDLLTLLADRSTRLLEVDAAGILLADASGNLRVMAASNDQVRLLELFQLQNQQGPCLEAYATKAPVIESDLAAAVGRWPLFAKEATGAGYQSVAAFPLRLREVVIGALNLFRVAPGGMVGDDMALAQALADVASIAILQDQAIRAAEVRAGELQHALDSRIAIEQAKGMVAERAQVEMADAFKQLRNYARSHNRLLAVVAREIVEGTLPLDAVTE